MQKHVQSDKRSHSQRGTETQKTKQQKTKQNKNNPKPLEDQYEVT